jgi:hypothetical protein
LIFLSINAGSLLSVVFVLGIEMTNNNNNNNLNSKNKKNNVTITAATAIAILLPLAAPLLLLSSQSAYAAHLPVILEKSDPSRTQTKAPSVISGENVYIAWWTNNTENGIEEVMFRASNDGGATFGDKINLSNTTDSHSWRVDISGEGDNVLVSWWETNKTSDVPVARISNDAGQTFGPLLALGANGTIGSGEAEEVT